MKPSNRRLMKALAISNREIELSCKLINTIFPLGIALSASCAFEVGAMRLVPSSCYMLNRPKLDKRRFKRWNKAKNIPGMVLSINQQDRKAS